MIYTVNSGYRNKSISEMAIDSIEAINDIYISFVEESYEYKIYGALYESDDNKAKKSLKEKVVGVIKSVWEKISKFFKGIAQKISEFFQKFRRKKVKKSEPSKLQQLDSENKPIPKFNYFGQDSFDVMKTCMDSVYKVTREMRPNQLEHRKDFYNMITDQIDKSGANKPIQFTGSKWVDIPKCFPESNGKTVEAIGKTANDISKQAQEQLSIMKDVVDNLNDEFFDTIFKLYVQFGKELIELGSEIYKYAVNMLNYNLKTYESLLNEVKESTTNSSEKVA